MKTKLAGIQKRKRGDSDEIVSDIEEGSFEANQRAVKQDAFLVDPNA
jgi:hypothetical protein